MEDEEDREQLGMIAKENEEEAVKEAKAELLDDVEQYLLKRTREMPDRMQKILQINWLRDRFAELRMREESRK